MIEKSELLRIPAFEGLPDDQLDWFISQSTEVVLKAGDIFLQQGTPAVWMIIMLEGQMQMRGALGGEAVSFPLEPGDDYRTVALLADEGSGVDRPGAYRRPYLEISLG